ncbi:MAG: L,D-transpeptidase [Leptolinea sp.]|jgi:lipoprotein-anchoring transpeptidase ErfK/SrfK|nr:L,D-transpeptidase [Leptolinea sp.]
MSLSAAQSALDHAWHLVRKGEITDARFWASEAASMDPGLEEAWLILAALSDPYDSFEYLRRALEINPRSRRGNRGVRWAEELTGRSFAEYQTGLHDYLPEFTSPFREENYPTIDFSAIEAEKEPLEKPSFSPPEPVEEKISPQVEAPETELRTIIQQRRPRPKPASPVNPWSVLLPYTVSFVIFLFFSTIWLLSGLPSVRAESVKPNYSTDELVKQILTAIPKATSTITPSPTPSPTRTPTKIPTITQTHTPQPTNTPIPTTPEATDTGEENNIPILIGDQIADTLEDGRWIEVDLAHQKVRAYAREILLKEFLVSTGTTAHPTVTGSFHVYIKRRYADMRGPGYYLPNVPYTMYFYQSYGLHGTYWHHNFGTPMSHGCVNLRTDDAKWLYEWASIGTLVFVH